MSISDGDRDSNGKFLSGNSLKAPDFTDVTAVVAGQKSARSKKQRYIDAARQAFIDGENGWEYGVEIGARVLVDMIHDENSANRDKIMAWRELRQLLTTETAVEMTDQDGRRVKAGSVDELEALLELMKQQQAG